MICGNNEMIQLTKFTEQNIPLIFAKLIKRLFENEKINQIRLIDDSYLNMAGIDDENMRRKVIRIILESKLISVDKSLVENKISNWNNENVRKFFFVYWTW